MLLWSISGKATIIALKIHWLIHFLNITGYYRVNGERLRNIELKACLRQYLNFYLEELRKTTIILTRNFVQAVTKLIYSYSEISIWLLVQTSAFLEFSWGFPRNPYQVSCHYDMARPQAVDGQDDHQLWIISVNIISMQSRTADNRWSSIVWVGLRAKSASQ
jgi:hypothetical protein